MVRIFVFLITLALFFIEIAFAQDIRGVEYFEKVTISPHIHSLVEGSDESVTIESNKVNAEKLNIEVNDKSLRIHLKEEKEITKDTTVSDNDMKMQSLLYKETNVTTTIVWINLNDISIRV